MEQAATKQKRITKKGILMIVAAAALLIVGVAMIIAAVTGAFSKSKSLTLEAAGISDNSLITLTAHRGYSSVAPENTMPAFEKAAEAGYAAVEFDTYKIADGTWVLMHDPDIDRMTDGNGKIESLTYKQLLEFSIDSGNGIKDYENIKIPTLRSVLQKCKSLKIAPVIEIKSGGTQCVEDLLSLTAGYSFKKYSIISFSAEQIIEAERLLKETPMKFGLVHPQLRLLVSELDDNTLEFAKAHPNVVITFNGNESKNTDKIIKSFIDSGVTLYSWTIDEPQRLAELYSLGITDFTTNSITYNK